MSALIQPMCVCIFAGAFVAAAGTIVATVAPRYQRILRLAAQGFAAS